MMMMIAHPCPNFSTGFCHARQTQLRISVDDFEAMEQYSQTHVGPMCIDCTSALAFYRKTDTRRAFFRHTISNPMPMTEWHRRWQSHFPCQNTEVRCDSRIADVKLSAVKRALNCAISGPHLRNAVEYGVSTHIWDNFYTKSTNLA
jgi:hypothetical protein